MEKFNCGTTLLLSFVKCWMTCSGERGLSADHERAGVEKIPWEFLRPGPGVGTSVSVFHHLRPVYDGQRHLTAHWLDRLSSESVPAHQYTRR